MPTITAVPATTTPSQGGADQSLPDPSKQARKALLALIVVAAGVAIVMNCTHATAKSFTPKPGDANFSIFAGFYIGAQVIERLMELVVPLLPAWPPTGAAGEVLVAHIKADRAKLALGVAGVLGTAASAGFGLFILQAVGIHASHTVDSLATGLVIAAGTKPLHDFIGLLQKQTSPTTGSTAT